MANFIATSQRNVRTTHYANGDNHNGDGRMGSNATSSGVDIDPDHYTAAVPMGTASQFYNAENPYKIGDLLLIESEGRKVIVLATDVGTLPHGAVDLVQGVATRALGKEEGVTVTRIGSIREADGDKPARDRLIALRNLLKEINEGRQPASALLQAGLTQTASNIDFTSLTVTNRSVQQPQPTAPVIEQPSIPPAAAYSVAALQSLLEKAGLATDKGGANDGKVDNIKGQFTNAAINEAERLLGKQNISETELMALLKDDATLAQLRTKVEAEKQAGKINPDGFLLTPNAPRVPSSQAVS